MRTIRMKTLLIAEVVQGHPYTPEADRLLEREARKPWNPICSERMSKEGIR